MNEISLEIKQLNVLNLIYNLQHTSYVKVEGSFKFFFLIVVAGVIMVSGGRDIAGV